jgi:GNAT superfamily N-acetyltransferase
VIRRAETRADFEAHAACWGAVWPEDAVSVDFMLERAAREPERLYLNAVEGDRVVGTGVVGRSSRRGFRPVVVTVRPERRGEGLGSELLERCFEHARSLAASTAIGMVREEDTASVGFVNRRGFEILDRVVSLALDLEPGTTAPAPPDGIEIVVLDEPRYEGAFAVYSEGVVDSPTAAPLDPGTAADFVAEVKTHPLTLVALDGELVVGYAALELRNEAAGIVGNDLTAVLRSHRRRGIAEALKRVQIAWAAEHGYRRLTTSTNAYNEPMRGLNEKLGFRPGPALLDVSRPL